MKTLHRLSSPVYLLENKEAQAISVFTEKTHAAQRVMSVIQSMLLKVNHDVMGAGLAWETYVENNTRELVSLSEAKRQKLAPWFDSNRQLETEKTSTGKVDLETFLESLS
uniref:Uncharacterized protein n=1 Tax=Aplanochytrium stocchinoi TaxID=215587 RepID=A0A7S3LGE5_9STRA